MFEAVGEEAKPELKDAEVAATAVEGGEPGLVQGAGTEIDDPE